jgi:hypothetical protein
VQVDAMAGIKREDAAVALALAQQRDEAHGLDQQLVAAEAGARAARSSAAR